MKNRFRRSNNSNNKPFIDFAPYADFLFSMLIVFIIATPIMLGGVKIDLPKGKSELIVVNKEPIIISIEKDGSLFLEKNPIKLNVLASRLNDYAMGDKSIKIFVKADKDILYHRVITVVGSIYDAGFHDVTLVTYNNKI